MPDGVWSATVECRELHVYQTLMGISLMLDEGDVRTLRRFGLTSAQFNALRHLQRDRSNSINDLARLLICDKSNATRLVDRLLRDGLVERKQDPDDRRFVRVRLTNEGVRLRDGAVAAHHASIRARFTAFDRAELHSLDSLLTALYESLRHQLDSLDVHPDEEATSVVDPADIPKSDSVAKRRRS